MFLQPRLDAVDSLRMETATTGTIADSSDQELVDLYAVHAGATRTTEMTESQIYEASVAAYALEFRGYFEQAGFWLHDSRPALRATA